MRVRSSTQVVTILAGVSILSARIVFYILNDQEGPNLLITTVLAGCIFSVLYFVYAKVR